MADLTYPHDYRVICEHDPAPVIVGGQAVNIWAISFLERNAPELRATTYGSKDLDILADSKVQAHLKELPGWTYQAQSFRNWADTRVAVMQSTASDGRKLLVEVLHSVHGLQPSDLKAAEYVRQGGITYRVLDPVAMLQAKAANVRDLDQAGPPPRQDRSHLQLLARCVPPYLREVHRIAQEKPGPESEKQALHTVSRTFKVLQTPKIAETLRAEGIKPAALVPEEFAQSPLERIRRAYEFQMRNIEAEQKRHGYGFRP